MYDVAKIEDLIYEVDGQLVMFSSDLAKIYGFKSGAKVINQTVNRNNDRFKENDTWILEKDKINTLLVTVSDQKTETRGGKFNKSRVFTKNGIIILSGIIRVKEKEKITGKVLTAFSLKNENQDKDRNALIMSNNNEYIKNMIYEIDGKFVMLDSDLAILYKCRNGTKEVNQAVKNNLKKFPEKYSWVLSYEESLNLRSKIDMNPISWTIEMRFLYEKIKQ